MNRNHNLQRTVAVVAFVSVVFLLFADFGAFRGVGYMTATGIGIRFAWGGLAAFAATAAATAAIVWLANWRKIGSAVGRFAKSELERAKLLVTTITPPVYGVKASLR